jgi:hypothetical protein
MTQKIVAERKSGTFPEIKVSPSFFEPMPPEEVADWYGDDERKT